MFMLLTAFISWWYGDGWKSVFSSYERRLNDLSETFSVRQLIRTLFDPWRRIISYPGASITEKFRAWGDNIVSRAVGFCVRILFLLGGLISAIAIIIFTTVEIIIWPLIPILIPIFLIGGLII